MLLSFVGKSIMIGAHDGANVPKMYAQFVPTLPMLLINFAAWKYLWNKPELRLRSQVGKKWTRAYGAEFVVGHGLYTIFAVKLGFNYIAVGTATGTVAATVMFFVNTWLGRRDRETTPA